MTNSISTLIEQTQKGCKKRVGSEINCGDKIYERDEIEYCQECKIKLLAYQTCEKIMEEEKRSGVGIMKVKFNTEHLKTAHKKIKQQTSDFAKKVEELKEEIGAYDEVYSTNVFEIIDKIFGEGKE